MIIYYFEFSSPKQSCVSFVLLVANLRVLSKSYPKNTNMTGFKWFRSSTLIVVVWPQACKKNLKRLTANKKRPHLQGQ